MALTETVNVSFEWCNLKTEKVFQKGVKVNAMQSN